MMAIISEILTHKIRFIKTSILYLAYIFMGLMCAVMGPTLLDLRQAVNANTQQISIIFPITSVGSLIGALITGEVYERFDSQLLIAFVVFIMSVCEALIPWNRSVISLSVNQFMMGLSGGGLGTAGNVWILHLWGKMSSPFMQCLHFNFGLGAFIAPIIAEPFLSKRDNYSDAGEEVEDTVSDEKLMIWCPFTIIAGLGALSVILLVIMYFIKSSDKSHPSVAKIETRSQMTSTRKFLFLFISAVIFHCFSGIEKSFGRYITSFAFFSGLHLSKSTGAYMTSIFYGTFTICRFLSVFIIGFVGNKLMIFAEIFITIVANIVLIFFGNTSETCLWIGIALMGIGCSAIWATLFSFVGEVMSVTSRIGGLFSAINCLGEFTIPLIVGYYIESNPLVLIYVTLLAAIVCAIFFTILCLISKSNNKTVYTKQNTNEENT